MPPTPHVTLADIDVAVLAGGLGTRIRGVLGDTPKVLAPVAGRPFLAHLLDRLAGFGARRVVLCLGHLAEHVEIWLAQNPHPGLEVVTIVEAVPLGTAGALRLARPALTSDPVLVLNGDTLIDADLGAFASAHRAGGTPASVLCVAVDDGARYGRVTIGPDGRIARFAEKVPGGPGIINAGVYLFGAAWLDGFARGNAISLERDVLMVAPSGTLGAVIARGHFVDIGTPESLATAAAILACPGIAAGEPA